MAHGVTFGSYHTYDNLGLSMSEQAPNVGSAEIYENYIDIPGGIPLDASEYPAGYITYKKREMSFRFLRKNNEAPWASTVSAVMNAIHGHEVDITLDDEPAWHYHGRVKVQAPEVTEPLTAINVNVTALPYKEYARSLKDVWQWDETDFANDINLLDTGYRNLSVGSSSNGSKYIIPWSPCVPTVTATLVVTGFYGSATTGSLVARCGNASQNVGISATGTYTATVKMTTEKPTSSLVYVSTANLVGTLTIDYTPRSL